MPSSVINPGENFGAYGLPKASLFFLAKQMALECGSDGVRVNGINADRIRSGLLDDALIAERATARGVDEATYLAGNLLHKEVEAHHVAEAFLALAMSKRTTGHVMTVDGGNIEASLRQHFQIAINILNIIDSREGENENLQTCVYSG